jgi:Zn-dependent peptidase ImmA (M78 family)
MKKTTEKSSVPTRTIESDLKKILQNEEDRRLDAARGEYEYQPSISLEEAAQLFDRLRGSNRTQTPASLDTNWTHPSVLALPSSDPASLIIKWARGAVLSGMEHGWTGPPYNPFTLAEMRGVKLVPTEEVLDARTRSDSKGQFIIEFNPQRPAARMRYSIAHELGHTLFPDCATEIRNRTTHAEMTGDSWQLESLCNMAAAEILMPFGTLQEELSIRPSAGRILELRHKYLVSCEAVINRLIRLSAYPCLAFFARRDNNRPQYFIEYRIASPGLQEHFAIHRGYMMPQSSKVSECTVIGSTQREDVRWVSGGKSWFVEYLGISPNPGESFPRVLGLAFPSLPNEFGATELMTIVKGDASEPIGAEPKLLLQLVNDQAQIWGGGFAKQNGKKWRHAQAHFRQWAFDRHNLKLGNIHFTDVRPDLTLVSLIAQHGFGKPTSGPRIRYGNLFSALEKVADLAIKKKATVHMPKIGTAEARGDWNIIEGIIQETLVSRAIKVTIYDWNPPSHNFPRQPSFVFPQEMVDEVF